MPPDLARLAKGAGRLDLVGAPEGFDALVVADLAKAHKGLTVFVARDGPRARDFAAALSFFDPKLEPLHIPSWDCLPYDLAGGRRRAHVGA
jgi:transcription-repair coupling factor (superfamily II helicase)